MHLYFEYLYTKNYSIYLNIKCVPTLYLCFAMKRLLKGWPNTHDLIVVKDRRMVDNQTEL
jgi:hypothetical protein